MKDNKGKLLKTYSKTEYPLNNHMFSLITKTCEVYENCIVVTTRYISNWNSSYDEEKIEMFD